MSTEYVTLGSLHRTVVGLWSILMWSLYKGRVSLSLYKRFSFFEQARHILFYRTYSRYTQHNHSEHKQIWRHKRNQKLSSGSCWLNLFLTILWRNLFCWNLVMKVMFWRSTKMKKKRYSEKNTNYPYVMVLKNYAILQRLGF